MSHLIAACLTDLRAITLDLTLRARTSEAGGLHHIVGRLLAAPLLRVQAGIYDQASGTEQERLKKTGSAERILCIDTQLVGELLRVQGPAFRIGREEAELAECRNVLRFLR